MHVRGQVWIRIVRSRRGIKKRALRIFRKAFLFFRNQNNVNGEERGDIMKQERITKMVNRHDSKKAVTVRIGACCFADGRIKCKRVVNAKGGSYALVEKLITELVNDLNDTLEKYKKDTEAKK